MSVILNNGRNFFKVGVGTYLMKDEEQLRNIIINSFKIGYRLIDTAKVYKNESLIGGIMSELDKFGLKREDVFLTTKLSTSDQGLEKCRTAILEAKERLQVSYIDLVLIHFPGSSRLKPTDPKNIELRCGSWQGLEQLYEEGVVRSIGVSNYTVKHLEELLGYAKVKPAVNQFEVHPLYYNTELIDFCRKNSIVVQAYSSLGAKDGWPILSTNETLANIAAKYNKSVAQICLKWALQHDICIIPKTSRVENLKPNFDLFDFEISPEDMKRIDGLNQNRKFCWDPQGVC